MPGRSGKGRGREEAGKATEGETVESLGAKPRHLYSATGAIQDLWAKERKCQGWCVFRTNLPWAPEVSSLTYTESVSLDLE